MAGGKAGNGGKGESGRGAGKAAEGKTTGGKGARGKGARGKGARAGKAAGGKAGTGKGVSARKAQPSRAPRGEARHTSKATSSSGRLGEYERKRDFRRTGEPRGRRSHDSNEAIFVVQQHDATRLHYDFRIEVDGVLVSWAVPKGPSLDPHERRLAQPTEDHPKDYADFEGVIAKGEYGAGPVIVWDRGVYRNVTEERGKPVPVATALDGGHVSIVLAGEKLHGGFALTRIRRNDSDESWLLVKKDDEYADPDADVVAEEPKSVASGKTIEDVADSG
jgi:DNA ligase D-like protein (predicted 3'-phosphoesterase)